MRTAVARLATLPAIPVGLAVMAAALLGAVILAVTGADPLEAYRWLIRSALSRSGLPFTVATAVPLVGMALAFAVPLRGGVINLGGEGQLVGGAISAALTSLYLPLPGPVVIVVAVLVGVVVGGGIGLVAAVLENRLGAPLIITSLLLSYPVVSLASYLARYPFADVGSGLPQTHPVPPGTRLPALLSDPTFNVGVLLILAVVLAYHVIDARTSAGFELRMSGINRAFVAYTGVERATINDRVMFAGGAMAGLVGAIMVLSPPFRFIDGSLTGPAYTWTGLLAALLAGGRALPVLAAGSLFAVLEVGGLGMERMTSVPSQLTAILQAVIIVFLAARAGLFRRGGRP